MFAQARGGGRPGASQAGRAPRVRAQAVRLVGPVRPRPVPGYVLGYYPGFLYYGAPGYAAPGYGPAAPAPDAAAPGPGPDNGPAPAYYGADRPGKAILRFWSIPTTCRIRPTR